MPLTTRGSQSEPTADDITAGPPSAEELARIIDSVPNGGVPGRLDEGEYMPDEPGEPGWPAAPVPSK